MSWLLVASRPYLSVRSGRVTGCCPCCKPQRHSEGGTTEARPNVPFGTGGELPGISLPIRQKVIRLSITGDSRLPAGQASSCVVGMTGWWQNDEERNVCRNNVSSGTGGNLPGTGLPLRQKREFGRSKQGISRSFLPRNDGRINERRSFGFFVFLIWDFPACRTGRFEIWCL